MIMDKEIIAHIRRFPEYKNIILNDSIPDDEGYIVTPSQDEELINMIFAPDPRTGIPRSDLAIVMSNDSSPEISQYIRDTLMAVQAPVPNAGDDPELALEGIKQREESVVKYMERLRDYVNQQ